MLRYGRIVIVSISRSRGLKFGTLLDDFVQFQQFEAFMVRCDGIDANCSDFKVNTIHRHRWHELGMIAGISYCSWHNELKRKSILDELAVIWLFITLSCSVISVMIRCWNSWAHLGGRSFGEKFSCAKSSDAGEWLLDGCRGGSLLRLIWGCGTCESLLLAGDWAALAYDKLAAVDR